MLRSLQNTALRELTRSYWWRIFALCLLTLLHSLLQVSMALLSREVIDSAITADGQLPLWGTLLVADILALVAANGLLNWYSGSIADQFSAQLRQKLLCAATYSQDVRLQGFHSGQLLSRGMEDVQAICDGCIHVLPSMVGQITRLVAAFAAVIMISPRVSGVLAVAAVVVGSVVAVVRPFLKKRQREVRQADEKVMSTMQESLQQLELIQSLDVQQQILTRFDRAQKASLKEKFRRRSLSIATGSVMNLGVLAGTGLLLLWGASKVAVSPMSYGSLIAMLQLFSLFRGPVMGLSGLWTRLAAVDVAAERLADLLTIPIELPPTPVADVEAVLFRDVTFAYPGDDVAVLDHFSACFPLNRWSCLTGLSGKGKSTIFKLILGLYDPQSGQVLLKTKTGEIPCGSQTRHLFAYVPQNFTLFSGSIRENLELVSRAEDAVIRDALHIAAADFVWELAEGDQTQVLENNAGLSKGQIQRLAIVRAVLMNRKILLLDECTSALDAQTEQTVWENLHKMGSKAIVITHRPGTLDSLDGITQIPMGE